MKCMYLSELRHTVIILLVYNVSRSYIMQLVCSIDYDHDNYYSVDTIAQARSFSTGLIPACCPLSFLFNSLFFWVPFSGNGFNTHRLEAIRQSVDSTKLTLTDKGPTSCC